MYGMESLLKRMDIRIRHIGVRRDGSGGKRVKKRRLNILYIGMTGI
jgi:hypothetical protein